MSTESTLKALSQPTLKTNPLHELIRTGARKLISEAIDAELATLIPLFPSY